MLSGMAQHTTLSTALPERDAATPKVERRPRSTTHSLVEVDASAYLGFSTAFLRQGRQHGGGPAYIKSGRAIRYRVTDLDAWLAAHRVETRERGRVAPALPREIR